MLAQAWDTHSGPPTAPPLQQLSVPCLLRAGRHLQHHNHTPGVPGQTRLRFEPHHTACRLFTTTRTTLTHRADSMLAGMFGGGMQTSRLCDASGHPFLDRCGRFASLGRVATGCCVSVGYSMHATQHRALAVAAGTRGTSPPSSLSSATARCRCLPTPYSGSSCERKPTIMQSWSWWQHWMRRRRRRGTRPRGSTWSARG